MVGIDTRSTMDMDTTIKGMAVNQAEIEKVINDLLKIDVGDNVTFEFTGIKNIHDISEYEDFRVSIKAHFFTMWVNLKIDITTGDIIVPKEEEYSFKLMFEDRYISIKAYNINTILAEKIETILSRNILNTRARDFYDVYILLTLRKMDINKPELLNAIKEKSEERKSTQFINDYHKYLDDIKESPEIETIWNSYCKKYNYAQGINLQEIISLIEEVMEHK